MKDTNSNEEKRRRLAGKEFSRFFEVELQDKSSITK